MTPEDLTPRTREQVQVWLVGQYLAKRQAALWAQNHQERRHLRRVGVSTNQITWRNAASFLRPRGDSA